MSTALVAVERDFVAEYCQRTLLALGLERVLECNLYRGRQLARPILDLGCGDGLFAQLVFGDRSIEQGLDPDERVAEIARARGTYSTVHVALGQKMPIESGSLATVISNSVLEHIPDLESVLRETARVLRANGELWATVPTDRFDGASAVARVLR